MLAQLDGTRTLGEIGDAYAGRFGRPARRPALGAAAAAARRAAAAGRRPRRRRPPTPPRSTVLSGRIRLVADAPGLIERLHRATGPLLRRPALVVAAALVVAMLAVLAADARRAAGRHRAALPAAGGAGRGRRRAAAEHRGRTSWRTGWPAAPSAARSPRSGCAGGCRWSTRTARWRTSSSCPAAWQQVTTAAAGAVANLLFLLPFAVAWLLVPAGAADPAGAGRAAGARRRAGGGEPAAAAAAGRLQDARLRARRRPAGRRQPALPRAGCCAAGPRCAATRAGCGWSTPATGSSWSRWRPPGSPPGCCCSPTASARAPPRWPVLVLIALLVLWRAGLALRGRREETA